MEPFWRGIRFGARACTKSRLHREVRRSNRYGNHSTSRSRNAGPRKLGAKRGANPANLRISEPNGANLAASESSNAAQRYSTRANAAKRA